MINGKTIHQDLYYLQRYIFFTHDCKLLNPMIHNPCALLRNKMIAINKD